MKKALKVIAIMSLTLALLQGCGAKKEEANNVASAGNEIKFLSIQNENTGAGQVVNDLSKEFAQKNSDVKYEMEVIDQPSQLQKISVLLASDSLPTIFPPFNEQVKEFGQKGITLNIEEAFKKIGIFENLKPAAVEFLKQAQSASGKDLVAIPTELNVEGIWYNKKLFEENGIAIPKTIKELTDAAAKLKAKGIQPFAASGKEKWPLTRLVQMIAMRNLGSDAMLKVAKGELSITDKGFLDAAKTVADWGKNGYFGPDVNGLDYDTAQALFLNGKAAMFYMGSWAIRDFNNKEKNTLAENIGFFNVPTTDGGKGTLEDYSINCGTALALTSKGFEGKTQEWAKYVFSNYGNYAMKKQGTITGFKVTDKSIEMPIYTKMTEDIMGGVKNVNIIWEFALNNKFTTQASDSVQLLVIGKVSPEQYIKDLEPLVK